MALHYDGEIMIAKLELGPYGTNGYVVTCPQTRESVIIDTPAEPERILRAVGESQVKYILITHNHMDHLGALVETQKATGAVVGAHPADAGRLPLRSDLELNDGVEVRVGGITLKVLHTPGHTDGSICLLYGKHLFSGDTLFPGGPGKTASPGALAQIIESIESKLYPLPPETRVYPGHGADTTIGQSQQEYIVFASRPHDPGLCGDVLWLES